MEIRAPLMSEGGTNGLPVVIRCGAMGVNGEAGNGDVTGKRTGCIAFPNGSCRAAGGMTGGFTFVPDSVDRQNYPCDFLLPPDVCCNLREI